MQVERTQQAERPDSLVSETSSVRDSVGSFKEWEDYNTALQDVLNWLSQAERTLESQERISDDVDAVKKQFHGHEVNKRATGSMLSIDSQHSTVEQILLCIRLRSKTRVYLSLYCDNSHSTLFPVLTIPRRTKGAFLWTILVLVIPVKEHKIKRQIS